jgi:hypothetical protein
MLFPSFKHHSKKQKSVSKRVRIALSVDHLEDRSLPSTFSVLNLNDSGAGSLRQAIQNSNSHPGADVIDFNVAGIIRLTSGALPTITGDTDIDGTSAPGFISTPTVEVNFNHFGGLQFSASSAGSILSTLSRVNATGTGATLNGGGNMIIAGN